MLTTMAKEGGRWEDRETVGVENPCLTCLERLECVLGDLVLEPFVKCVARKAGRR